MFRKVVHFLDETLLTPAETAKAVIFGGCKPNSARSRISPKRWARNSHRCGTRTRLPYVIVTTTSGSLVPSWSRLRTSTSV